jgi:hypothetical protein
MRSRRALVPKTFVAALAAVGLIAALAEPATAAPTTPAVQPVHSKAAAAVMYSSDGMRPDLMQKYAAAGLMPTYKALMAQGATGANGLEQGFPPNTGQGWYTMATGAWPGTHGSTNNTFFDVRQPFTSSSSFAFHGNGTSPGIDPTAVLEAQSVANSAEAAGKHVAQIEWTGGLNGNINGPTVDFDTFYSQRGVLDYPLDTTQQASAAKFGLSYQVAAFTPASGWTNVPAPQSPGGNVRQPMQTTLTLTTTFASQNPTRTYDLYIYASRAGLSSPYDKVLMVPSAANKDASKAAASLSPGDWAAIKLTGADGLIGTAAGRAPAST